MTVTYELSAKDFLEAFKAHRNSKPIAKWSRRIFIALIGTMFAFALISVLGGPDGDVQTVLPALLVLVIWISILWGLPRWSANRQFRGQPGAQGPRRVVLDEAGVHWRWNGGSSDVEWKNFVRWVEGKNQFLLYSSPVAFNLVPKRTLTTEESDTVRALLQKNIPVGR